ncbi:MAG: type II toxin-antitoxin system HicB family antitoxin [Actinobacteria bacterium]|nr:type II toxin-antitoxin system HicB family antitoxin [Actinomycetota bacterium]
MTEKHDKAGYAIEIFYSDEDEGYIAVVPDLEGCSAGGDTPQEALGEVLIAMDLWLETARSRGFPIPEPRYRAPSVAQSSA